MKFVFTPAGRVIVKKCLIILAAFFFVGVATFAAFKIVENSRVNSLPSVADAFSKSDISYNNWSSLKSSFKARYTEVSNFLKDANKLKESYPKNAVLAKKIQSYVAYLDSMDNASFDCPEHCNMYTMRCPKCGGSGKGNVLKLDVGDCNDCGGSGKQVMQKSCPHCGSKSKSTISGKKLLEDGGAK